MQNLTFTVNTNQLLVHMCTQISLQRVFVVFAISMHAYVSHARYFSVDA